MQSGSVSTAAFDGAAEASTARGTGRGQALATQTFALLKRNGKKGLTETPAPRGGAAAFGGLRRSRRQRGGGRSEASPQRVRSGGRGSRGSGERGAGGTPEAPERGDSAETPRSAALCCPLAARCPALPRRDGRAPGSRPCPAARGRSLAGPGPVVLIPPASGGGEGGDNIDERVA